MYIAASRLLLRTITREQTFAIVNAFRGIGNIWIKSENECDPEILVN